MWRNYRRRSKPNPKPKPKMIYKINKSTKSNEKSLSPEDHQIQAIVGSIDSISQFPLKQIQISDSSNIQIIKKSNKKNFLFIGLSNGNILKLDLLTLRKIGKSIRQCSFH
jgi:hypothetical protein